MSALAVGRLELLGVAADVDETWSYESVASPLWHYHAHYHDALAEAAWTSRGSPSSELGRRLATGLAGWMDHCG
jgi:hypothetical protein